MWPRGPALAAFVAAAAVGLTAACAQQGAPPGGPEDRRPPVVVRTEPDTFAIVTDFRGPIRFLFDERISERVEGGSIDDAVIVSPRTGDVRVRQGRQGLEIDVQGGFRPDVVYRVTLLPVVSDLFNNTLRDAFELVFSTGAPIEPTTIAGYVWDRISGASLREVDVQAIATEGDSSVHVAKADTGGIFAFRYLPAGRFRVVAFEDRNRNGVVDPMEPKGEMQGLVGAGDTLPLVFSVLQPDTTKAVLTRATALDSVTVLLEFDDFLDPAAGFDRAQVSFIREEGAAPGVSRLYHEHEYRDFIEAVQDSFARLDSIEGEARAAQGGEAETPAVGDTALAADPDTGSTAARSGVPPSNPDDDMVQEAAPAPPRRRLPARLEVGRASGAAPAAAARPRPDGSVAPARRMVVVLDAMLEPNVAYHMTIARVNNLNLVPEGGGEASVVLTPPDTVKAEVGIPDSAAVPDTGAAPDTSVVRGRGAAARSSRPRILRR